MQHPWLANYPPGVPAELPADRVGTIGEMFDEAVQRFGPKTAYLSLGAGMTYAELEERSRAFGAWLLGHCKLSPGDRIAVMMPNLLQYPIVIFGALRAGLVVVNTNPLYTARELEHQLNDSGARAIVVLENFGHVLEQVVGRTKVEHVVTTRVGDRLPGLKGHLVNFVLKYVKKQVPAFSLPGATRFNDALIAGSKLPFESAKASPDDTAFLQYTGGTTGVAKGADLTHGNITSNVAQSRLWLGEQVRDGEEVVITALPLYHIFALTANCLTFLQAGARNVLIANPRDMPAFVKTLSQYPFTVVTGVNTLFNALLDADGFTELDFSNLRSTLGGGMAVQPAVARRWKEVTGCALLEAYGLTETSPAVCINPFTLEDYNGSIGLPVSSTEVRIVAEDGAVLGTDEPGELQIRGPQVMRGYWQRPDDTAGVLDAEGWLRSGDMARIDADGYVYIVDRKKDMIIVSGFNVYPNEVEAVIAEHPGVVEVGVIGVPDERSGEAVKAIVVARDSSCDEAALKAHCADQLTNYKRPRSFDFVDELPKTNVGKILRRELRDRYVKAD